MLSELRVFYVFVIFVINIILLNMLKVFEFWAKFVRSLIKICEASAALGMTLVIFVLAQAFMFYILDKNQEET